MSSAVQTIMLRSEGCSGLAAFLGSASSVGGQDMILQCIGMGIHHDMIEMRAHLEQNISSSNPKTSNINFFGMRNND